LIDIQSLGFPKILPVEDFGFRDVREDSVFPCGAEYTIMPNATKALREKVKSKPSHKFGKGKGDDFVEICMSIILVTKRDMLVIKMNNSMIGDGNIMSVSCQISNKSLLSAKRRFGINDPVFSFNQGY
jgi:hypothetical protein